MGRVSKESAVKLSAFIDSLPPEVQGKCALCTETLTHIVKQAEAQTGVGTATATKAIAEKHNETAVPRDKVTGKQLQDRVRYKEGKDKIGNSDNKVEGTPSPNATTPPAKNVDFINTVPAVTGGRGPITNCKIGKEIPWSGGWGKVESDFESVLVEIEDWCEGPCPGGALYRLFQLFQNIINYKSSPVDGKPLMKVRVFHEKGGRYGADDMAEFSIDWLEGIAHDDPEALESINHVQGWINHNRSKYTNAASTKRKAA